MRGCAGCSARDAAIRRQMVYIRRLERKLGDVADACREIIVNADNRMEAGGIPRAAWSYLKAARETAAEIASRL